MARSVSSRWLTAHLRPEYRMTVYLLGKQVHDVPMMLRYFRDGKRKFGSTISPIRDLGIKVSFDAVTVWSQDYEGMSSLATWFKRNGYDTSGVF